jgi:hypothetical protein
VYDRDSALKVYAEHEEFVRKTIPEKQLLVFDVKIHGWNELCGFLGVEDIPVSVYIFTAEVALKRCRTNHSLTNTKVRRWARLSIDIIANFSGSY